MPFNNWGRRAVQVVTENRRLDSEKLRKLRTLEICVDFLLFVYGSILFTTTYISNKDQQQLSIHPIIVLLFGGVILGCATGIKNNRMICLHWILYVAKIGSSIIALGIECAYLNQGWIGRVIFTVFVLVAEFVSMFLVMTGKIDALETENEAGFEETSV